MRRSKVQTSSGLFLSSHQPRRSTGAPCPSIRQHRHRVGILLTPPIRLTKSLIYGGLSSNLKSGHAMNHEHRNHISSSRLRVSDNTAGHQCGYLPQTVSECPNQLSDTIAVVCLNHCPIVRFGHHCRCLPQPLSDCPIPSAGRSVAPGQLSWDILSHFTVWTTILCTDHLAGMGSAVLDSELFHRL